MYAVVTILGYDVMQSWMWLPTLRNALLQFAFTFCHKKYRQYVSPKRRFKSARLHVVTTKNITALTFTAVNSPNVN
jgi:hypothetical protein